MSDFADKSFDMIERLQKMIEELEADLEQAEVELQHYVHLTFIDAGANPAISWKDRCNDLEQARTAERHRREECEAVLREVAGAPNRIAENSRIIADYFSRYPLPGEITHERE